MSKTPDRRITVSVNADLADKVDEYVSDTQNTNRSLVFEEALRLWESLAQYQDKDTVLEQAMKLYEQQQERELYRQYYAELGAEARTEDEGWRQLGEESAARHWPAGTEETMHS